MSKVIKLKRYSEITGLILITSSILLLVFFIIKPSEHSAWLGIVYHFLNWLKIQFGSLMYLFSFLLWYIGIQKFLHKVVIRNYIDYLGYIFLCFFSLIFFELINSSGGIIGYKINLQLISIFGYAGTFLISIIGILISVSIIFDILLSPIILSIFKKIANIFWIICKGIIFSIAFIITFGINIFKIMFKFIGDYISHKNTSYIYQNLNNLKVEKVEMFQNNLLDDEIKNNQVDTLLNNTFKNNISKDNIQHNTNNNLNQTLTTNLNEIINENIETEDVNLKNIKDNYAMQLENNTEHITITRFNEINKNLNNNLTKEQISKNEEKLFSGHYLNSNLSNNKVCIENTINQENKNDLNIKKETYYNDYIYPDPKLILKPIGKIESVSEEELKVNGEKLIATLKNFNIDAKLVHITCGPTVIRYEIQPANGVKVSKIVSLADDLALALATLSLRIEAPIPGKSAIGIEIPNPKPVPVYFGELISLPEFNESSSPLRFVLGKTITGQPIIADLKNMPHLLVAGTTGSGKSVCINTIISSILFHARPDEVKFLMVDPKMVELTGYNDIPHLIYPVVVKVKDVPFLLEWGIYEMERRYKLLSAFKVRTIDSFNLIVEAYNLGKRKLTDEEALELVEQKIDNLTKLPYLVIVIDELADIMMTDKSNKVEEYICRLAQMSRAVGIHLIVATQRPSVNVITGLIKANLPSRIAFAVSSVTDSRTILDCKGAEKLIGRGDMLYLPVGLQKPIRVQGAYLRDEEIQKLTEFLKLNYKPDYNDEIDEKINEYKKSSTNDSNDNDLNRYEDDELLYDAIKLVIENKMGSASMLQRILKIGHNRAVKLIEKMEKMGVVGPFEDKKPRKVLWTLKDLEENIKNVA